MLRLTVAVVAVLAMVAIAAIRLAPIPESASYTGSSGCAPCHETIYRAWRSSQHNKMMRGIDDPGVLVADFETDDPNLRFDREDAVWAIGGKWEQQFMGHDGSGETLLPGAWKNLEERWEFKGWDGWRVPEPRRRCHGCHTVGLDPETGVFVEANIGCEACHGPGSWHSLTLGLGAVFDGVGVQVCGQCHTRGTSISGGYFFPTGYRPGSALDDRFLHEEPSLGQNSSHWWGNGRPRDRHQEYLAWRQGGHSDALASLAEDYDGAYGPVRSSCLECHSGDYMDSVGRRPTLGEAREGVTCASCHNVHGDLATARRGCENCHSKGAYHHRDLATSEHIVCGSEARVACVDCHMPRSIEIGGAFALHDHSPGTIPPADLLEWDTPTSCQNGGCHVGADPRSLQAAYDTFYRGSTNVRDGRGAEPTADDN